MKLGELQVAVGILRPYHVPVSSVSHSEFRLSVIAPLLENNGPE
jgi:hypothetical protein